MGCGPSYSKKSHDSENSLQLGSHFQRALPDFNEQNHSYKNSGTGVLNGMLATAEASMSVLLLFPKTDALCVAWQRASEVLHLPCSVATTVENAVEIYSSQKQDVVVVDRRAGNIFASDTLVQLLKNQNNCTATSSIFIAICKSRDHEKDLNSVANGLRVVYEAGFNRRLTDNITAVGCLEELTCIQHNEFLLHQKLLAYNSTFTALQHVRDAVEITNNKFKIEYVNPAYEQMFGYSSSEDVIGLCSLDNIQHTDKSDETLSDLTSLLQKGKPWSGSVTARRNSGSSIQLHSAVYPVKGKLEQPQHYVCVRQPLDDRLSTVTSVKPNSYPKETGTLADRIRNSKKENLSRIHSMTIEAPIKKVIDLIHAAQQNSSPSVSQALETVLEILKTTDLYSAEVPDNDDEMTSDLVGGLMTGAQPSDRKRTSQTLPPSKRSSTSRTSEVMREHIAHVIEHHTSITQNIHSLNEIPEEFRPYLQGEDEWNYDILELERVTQGKSLVYLAMKTMQRFNVCDFLNCSEDTMLNWLQVIQNNYHADNDYHNSTHAADVMQSTAVFMRTERLRNVFDEMDEVASLLAALVHDLDHPGRTNPFLINSRHKLAILYNDTSVLESHHVALAFDLTTKDDRINIFKNLSPEDYKALRISIIDMVLATEMAKHFEHLGKFITNIVHPCLPNLVKEGGDHPEWSEVEEHEFLTKQENKSLIKRIMIKCSDVSNPCRPLKLCKEWAKRIAEEYFQQTDEEKSRGLPVVMPNFDRTTCNMPHSQTSFIDFFLREMFCYWDAFCELPDMINNLNDNYDYWKQQHEEARRAEEAMKEEPEDFSS